ncbi:hypothetical protein OUZ56_027276 [Daphnia magna]|uniref:Uncharacterized protein n=1 Tax=Daphnia magna TaxID=35525 RepID=A0ABQ9ZPP7_9CRUS|nr:hypothetical protein OUZ56_027276 [Daphnia magna]
MDRLKHQLHFFGLQMFIFLRYNTAVSTLFVVSPPVDHATTFSSSSFRCLRLHLIAVFVDVFTFISVSSSSWTSSPSSPSRRRLGRLRPRHHRLCPRHHLVAGFAFALFALHLRPSRREFSVDRRHGTGRNGLRRKAP